MTTPEVVVGLLLAAGAGSRMGRPKALVEDDDGAWLPRAVAVLRDGGCADVVVVLGAAAEEAAVLVPGVRVVVADDWAEGLSASLRAGLTALADGPAAAALVLLVDLPDLTPAVVARLRHGSGPTTLRRATYAGRPGHPVVLGRGHWAGVVTTATGDTGARDYLAAHDVERVDCSDLATGVDVDVDRPR